MALMALQLSACLIEPVDSGVTASVPSSASLSITFTKPANTSVIQTPDFGVNISGTVVAEKSIDAVTWQNDRGGKGTATGKENWDTGNIALQIGTNKITVTALDMQGNSASKTLTVERENITLIAEDPINDVDVAMYSYRSDLRDAAPVSKASILPRQVYFFVAPSDSSAAKGIRRIRIDCCSGMSGPGAGEDFLVTADAIAAPWSYPFDLTGYAAGGTRRIQFLTFFQDGTQSNTSIADFVIEESSSGNNSAPEISGTPKNNVTAGNRYDFQPLAQDPNGDTLRFSIENKPSWATFDQATGRLFGTPTADHIGLTHDSVTISVSDGKTSSSLPAFSISVQEFAAGTANLSWSIPTVRTDNTPLTNLAGFNIYYGQTSRNYSDRIRIRDAEVTNYMVDNLSSGTWYFVITAVDEDELESNPSGEGSKTF